MVVLRSCLIWGYISLTIPVLWVGAVAIRLLTWPFDRRRRLLHIYTCWWGAHYVYLCPLWTLQVEGRHHLPPGPHILTPNHQSLGDILCLFGLHRPFKWVSKESVFKVPFLGWNMSMNDYVPLRRGDRGSIEAMMDHCGRHLSEGSPLMIFPEGTRSMDGRLRPFKHGAFTLAVRHGVPVVPVVVEGTGDALPKQGFLFRNFSQVRIKILPPVYPGEVGGDPQRLAERVRARIVDELAQWRQVPADQVVQPAPTSAPQSSQAPPTRSATG